MSATSRSAVRKALAGLLTAALVGDGKPAQKVYDHKAGDFEGQSPVVLVTSAGSGRRHAGFNTTAFENKFDLVLQTWVLYADPVADWTEADAEDALDLIEKSIAEVLAANYSYAGYWIGLEYNGATEVIEATLGGSDYLIELTPVRIEVNDD